MDHTTYKELEAIANTNAENRPLNIALLMKRGFKHFIIVSEDDKNNPAKCLEAKEKGRIAKNRPSSNYNRYFAYNDKGLLTLYNADNNELITTFELLSLGDLVFYEYNQEKKDLLTFIKETIKEKVKRSFEMFKNTLDIKGKEEEASLNKSLRAFNKQLKQATKESIDAFIYLSDSFILQEILFFKALPNTSTAEKDFLYFLNYFKDTYSKQTELLKDEADNLARKLADFLKPLEIDKEAFFIEYEKPAKELIRKMYSNITSEQDSFNEELARLTTLLNTSKLKDKDYFIYFYYEYSNALTKISILESNLEEAIDLLNELEKGTLKSIIDLFKAIFKNEEEIALINNSKDILIKATDNIINALLKMRINAQKIISEYDLKLYRNYENLTQEEREALDNRLRRANKEDIKIIITYEEQKEAVAKADIELKATKKELKELNNKVDFSEDVKYKRTILEQKIEELKKQINDNIKPFSKNIILFDGFYYINKATTYIDTFINQEESGKVEITNEDGSLSILKETKTAINENALTYDILTLIIRRMTETNSNKIFFTLQDIYSYMIGKGELKEDAPKYEKDRAKDKFIFHCELLKGIDLKGGHYKQKGKDTPLISIGGLLTSVIYTGNKKKGEIRENNLRGVLVVYNETLYNMIIKNDNSGWLILPNETDHLTPQTSNLIVALRLLTKLQPNNLSFRAYQLASYVGLGDTHYTGKNKSRVIEPFNKILEDAENEQAIRVISEYPRELKDIVQIEDLFKSEEYKRALDNKKHKKSSKKKKN